MQRVGVGMGGVGLGCFTSVRDGDSDGFGAGDVLREEGRGEAVGGHGVEGGWGTETLAGEVVAAAGDGEERGVGERGEERRPGCEFVGVVGDEEGVAGKYAVVPGDGGRGEDGGVGGVEKGAGGRRSRGVEEGLGDEEELVEVGLRGE